MSQGKIFLYHQTTPPVPNHLRNATEELKSLRSKQLNFPKLPHSSFTDLSSKYKADKIKLFAEQFSPSNDTQDSIISLTKLGRATAESTSNPELVLTTILSKAVSDGMTYSRNVTKTKTAQLESIKSKILQYTTHNRPHDQAYLRLTTKRDQIQETLNFRHKFQKIAKHNAQNSRTTSYFLADSDHSPKSKITKLMDPEGNSHTDDNATRYANQFFKSFFTNKATSTPTNPNTIPDFLKSIPPETISKIPPEALETIPSNFTEEELDSVILKPHKGSAPGLTGTSYELIKHLYPIIKPLLLKFTNIAAISGLLSPTLRSKKVIFIPKPNKDPTNPSSLRPICLLEILFKIISSMIASRLKRLSTHVITNHQNAYSDSSSIINASRTIIDFRALASLTNSSLAIIGLDFSSAFDKIAHDFAIAAMNFFGFPTNLITKIKTLFNSPKITLQINGELGELFEQAPVGSGQGDPISSFIFTISIQILLLRLSYDPNIPNFQFSYLEHTTSTPITIKGEPSAFADDINLLQNFKHPSDLDYLLSTLNTFTSISNLPLNNSKTEFLPVNISPEIMAHVTHHQLKVVSTIKFVGAYITSDQPHLQEAETNFNVIDTKADSYMSKAKLKNSTVLGASILYNTKVISKFTHLLTNFHPSPERIDSMNTKAINFSREFSSSRFLVRKSRYFLPYPNAGMNLRNVKFHQAALLTHWWRQFQKPTISLDQNWAAVLRFHLNSIGIKVTDLPLLGHSDIHKIGEKLRKSSPFWSSTFIKTAPFLKETERKANNLALIPLFGGRFASLSKCPALSVFAKHGPHFLSMIRSNYSRLIDIGIPWNFSGFINCTELSKLDDLTFTNPISPPSPESYNFLSQTIISLFDSPEFDPELLSTFRYLVFKPLSTSQDEFRYKSSGCSKFYHLQINSYIQRNRIFEPPGRISAERAYDIRIPIHLWSSAIKKTMKATASPSAIDLAYKIFLRQNWTPEKQSLSKKDPLLSTCVSCGYHNANTAHIYLECSIAKDLWKLLDKLTSSTLNFTTNLTPQQILFHQNINSFSYSSEKVIIDLIITCKLTLQKIAFRDIHLPVINPYSLKSMFFNGIISTIFANRLAERQIPVYHIIYDKLISQHNSNLPISFT